MDRFIGCLISRPVTWMVVSIAMVNLGCDEHRVSQQMEFDTKQARYQNAQTSSTRQEQVTTEQTMAGAATDKVALPVDTLPQNIDFESVPLGMRLTRRVPQDNPLTAAKVALGRRLFFDPILSEKDSVSCASCHQPDHGFASPDAQAIGIGGAVGKRNSPTLFNTAFAKRLFWDGRSGSLEEQALVPIADPLEMASTVPAAIARLRADASYVAEFALAFGEPPQPATEGSAVARDLVTAENLGRAIASFERTLLLGGSPVDLFRRGIRGVLSPQQRRGFQIFEGRGECWRCHSGDNYADNEFHNTGVTFGQEGRDLGRFEHTGKEKDRWQFKTPTLRSIADTAPYMHDGSMATLREVVEFYNRGGHPDDPHLDSVVRPLELTESEIDDVLAFLRILSLDSGF